jgi:hypothetical protein
MADPKAPSRAQIARMAGNDPELIRLIEQLFEVAGQKTPNDVDGVSLGIPVDVAGQIGDLAARLDGLSAMPDALSRLTGQIEELLVAPPDREEKRTRYGQFFDTTTQAAAATGTAYSVLLATTDISDGVWLDGAKVYVDTPGVYNFQTSIQVDKTSGGTGHLYLWFAKNGSSIANSASAIRVQGNDAEVFSSVNLFVPMARGDYVELKWAVDDTSVQLQSFAAAPPVPAVPSVILTVSDNMENSR